MQSSTQPSLLDYYKNFKSICGALAAIVSAIPLASALLPSEPSAYSFPPVGDITMPARLGVFVLAAAATFVCFYSTRPKSGVARKFVLIASLSLMAFFCYLLSYHHFVRRIDEHATNSALFVSVGYERTVFATQTFDGETDWDMLRARGTSEEEVSRLWTSRSLDIGRLCLIASYCGFLLPIVAILSLGVRYQL